MSHYLEQTHQIDEVVETSEGFTIEYYSDIFGCDLIVTLKDINYDIERPEMIPIINVNTDDIQSVTLKLNINFMYKEFTLPLNLIDSIRKNNDHVEYYLSCELDEVISKTRWFVKLEEYLQSDEFGFQEDSIRYTQKS